VIVSPFGIARYCLQVARVAEALLNENGHFWTELAPDCRHRERRRVNVMKRHLNEALRAVLVA